MTKQLLYIKQLIAIPASTICCIAFTTTVSFAQTTISLQKALQTAKANNPSLKTEKYNINIAQADSITAQLRPNLILNNQSLQLAQGSSFAPITKWTNPQNRQVWWQLTKPIQWHNQRKYKIETANLTIKNSANDFAEKERNLFADIAVQWLDAWTSTKQLSLLYFAKNNLDSLVQINKYRFEKEVISKTDLLRTQLLAQQFEVQIANLIQQNKNSLKQLAFSIGTNDNIIIDTSDNFNYNLQLIADSLMQLALNKRTDIVAAKSSIAVANSNIQLQKSLATPQPELGVIYNPQNTVPYVGIFATIELPFFSRNQGEIKKSQLVKQQAEQNLTVLQQQVNTELTNTFNSFTTNQKNVDKFKLLLKQSQTILNNVKYAYLRGGTTIVDFLEAQRSWLETQQQYYDALQQQRESYIQLLFVTGYINQLAQ
jgi:cobalt-zinc-cadmium efflux system outer membrane protein